ncbi:homeobox-leucine zipper protein ATHB-12 [Ziziphus jujuba]|uniref:Homeobox-leucine zipper protein n=2 Tax=Ziziphus jujuba TaxID=326968 RepID=A0A6P4ARI9_ZIZJJ|nr:homeobox-leucine zipper protein ATHB-12 [Ziziphus jujuba]KAH7519439.1 hypothetical protein FEM48_Zijuj08G0036300 [Ziziphus jujuba var. spinosa]
MLDHAEYSYPPTATAETAAETFSCMNQLTASTRKKKSNKNKRRFSDEQIRSLETMFESETRLEPRKKLQLARELGLQPRQVAIWFQNKRARWKSKQLERDYSILRANYNSLASRFESLKKEKQNLLNQLQKLNDLVQRPREEGAALNSIDGESDNEEEQTKSGSQVKPSLSMEKSEHGVGVLSDEDSSIKAEYFSLEEETKLVNMVEPGDDSLTTSHEDWGSLNSDCLFDESSSGYQWWDFWS